MGQRQAGEHRVDRADRREAPAGTRLYGITFYLDEKSVMDLFLQDEKYKGALCQEVHERIIRNRKFKWSAVFPWIGGRVESDVSSEVVHRRSYQLINV